MDSATRRWHGAVIGLLVGVVLVIAGATAACCPLSTAGVLGFFTLLGAVFGPVVGADTTLEL